MELIALTQCFIHVLLCSSYQVSVFLKHLHFHTNQPNLLPDMLTYSAKPIGDISFLINTVYVKYDVFITLFIFTYVLICTVIN